MLNFNFTTFISFYTCNLKVIKFLEMGWCWGEKVSLLCTCIGIIRNERSFVQRQGRSFDIFVKSIESYFLKKKINKGVFFFFFEKLIKVLQIV